MNGNTPSRALPNLSRKNGGGVRELKRDELYVVNTASSISTLELYICLG